MFEWDDNKEWGNVRKHGISFADTFAVFEDPHALTLEDFVRGEERYVTIGMDCFGRILVVVYTWRGENIRIISARKANKSEIKQYEGKI
ncbi:MAG: BrnT family toxin [Planctomycetota bacterium]